MNRLIRATLGIVIALAAICCASPGFAQESAADKAAADALFSDAKKLMKQKKYDEACAKLAESLKLSQRLGTLLNLANCHATQGKTASAWAEFNEALAIAKRDNNKERADFARKNADKLEKQLVRLSFELPKGLDGASLSLDGKQIGPGALGTPLPIDPGPHFVEVSAPGKKAWTKQLVIENKPGTITQQVPALEPEEVASAPAPEPAPSPQVADKPRHKASSSNKTLAWVAMGAGVVGVGVGSYFGLRTFSKKSEADDHCGKAIGQSDSKRCDAAGVDLRDQAKSSATLSTVGFSVGALGLGVGIALLLTGNGKSEEAARRTVVAPALGAQSAALVFDTTF